MFTPARTLATSLTVVLTLITVGAATQSVTLGVILFLITPALVAVNLQVAWKHRRRHPARPVAAPPVRRSATATPYRPRVALPAAPATTAAPGPTRIFVAPAAAEPVTVEVTREVEVPRELTEDDVAEVIEWYTRWSLSSAENRKTWRWMLREVERAVKADAR